MKLSFLATRILFLLETHSEPEYCEMEDCDVCSEILNIRKIFNGDAKSKKSGGGYDKPQFLVIDEFGNEKQFITQTEVIRYVKTTRHKIVEMVETGIPYKGYTVHRIDNKE